MLEPIIHTWYMSRRLTRRVDDAADVLDCLTSLTPIRCDLPGAVLEAAPVPVGLSSPSGPVRRLRGRLRLRDLGPSVPVELELAAWSRRESELGIRPAGARLPRGRRAERYFAAAALVLGDLLDRMLVVPAVDDGAKDLQRVSTGPPSARHLEQRRGSPASARRWARIARGRPQEARRGDRPHRQPRRRAG